MAHGEGAAAVGYSGGQLICHRGAASLGYSGGRLLCHTGAAKTCCICDHERRRRTSDSVQAAVNVDAWGRVYCADVISASQVEQLMDLLQHIVATDDDDEVQLVNLAVQQRRGRRRRQGSPSYAEPALEHSTDVRPGKVGDATIPQPSVPAVEPTLFPQYRLFTLIYAKYQACSWVYAWAYTASYCRELIL